jgi:hypothetical protein
LPEEQTELSVQLVGQLAEPPLHTYRPQLGLPPEVLNVHVPLASHESQAPLQGELQQNPSTQLPDEHWVAFVQVVPFPYLQSTSWPTAQEPAQGAQPDGQNPSAVAPHARAVVTQAKVQAATVPVRVRMLLLSETQASDCVWHAEGGSHFSPASITEFPHTGRQSLSLLALHADGQHPSPFTHAATTVVFTHLAVQAAAVPCSARCWHPTGGQLAGQLVPSQLSLHATSVTPLPHWQAQSLSFALVHPEAQQPSPLPHVLMTVSFTHTAVQAAAVPCSFRF